MAGRPTKYKEEYAAQAYDLCLLGFTDKLLAEHFEVSESTLNLWKAHEEFSESIKKAKNFADANMARSLYHKGMDGDTTAQIFWLKNRQPRLWRDKQDIDMRADVAVTVMEIVTREEADSDDDGFIST